MNFWKKGGGVTPIEMNFVANFRASRKKRNIVFRKFIVFTPLFPKIHRFFTSKLTKKSAICNFWKFSKNSSKMVHRSVPYSSSLFLFIGNNLCGRQQRFLVTTIASLCVVVSPDNQTVNQEVEMGFWGRVQYLLVTTEPGKSLFTLHEIGGGIQSSD